MIEARQMADGSAPLEMLKQGGIAVLDYGSQYTQLIARRIRELDVYAEVFAWDAPPDVLLQHRPRGFVLSGGPHSVYEAGAPAVMPAVLDSGLPLLGICYGMQLLTHQLGGRVIASTSREYGPAVLHADASPLFEGMHDLRVWMSHGDRIEAPAPHFSTIAHSAGSPYAAISDVTRHYYGVQFHPEVSHTPQGTTLLGNFLTICGCEARWSPGAFIDSAVTTIRQQVGDGKVILGLSGGVDSAVAGALLQRAIGPQLTAIFVNNGLLRRDEAEQVLAVFRDRQGMNLRYHDATEQFLDALSGVTDPEAKRKIVGRLFIDAFACEAKQLRDVAYLAQGTIYPDVIESASGSQTAHLIKSHHNVGGLPEELGFRPGRATARPVQG